MWKLSEALLDVSRIEKLAFYNCSSLENIKIPDTANTIPKGAFYGCSNLKNIEIPENIKTIGNLHLQDAVESQH